jgi:hypothetical protein
LMTSEQMESNMARYKAATLRYWIYDSQSKWLDCAYGSET